jgi:serralysin
LFSENLPTSDDTLTGASGPDELHGGGGDDWLSGLAGDDRLFGGSGDDVLVGNRGSDRLIGGKGGDSLSGDGGRDVFRGGSGADVMDFGDDHAHDRAVYREANESSTSGTDVIISMDAGIDSIDLRRIDADSSTAQDDAFLWIGSAAFGGEAGELRYAQGLLEADLDGDGAADFAVFFSGEPPLTDADILN